VIAPRDACWALIPGTVETKRRPCVVLQVDSSVDKQPYALIVFGQGGAGIVERFAVASTSADGKVLRLTKNTFFRSDAIRWILVSKLDPPLGKVSPSLFLELDALLEAAHKAHRVAPKPAGAAEKAVVSTPESVARTAQPHGKKDER
jgi:hypothetical protein